MALRLSITHSVLPINTERRFDADISVGDLKAKLYAIVGTSPEYQVLQRRDKDGNVMAVLDNNDRPVSSYGINDFASIHVVDTDPLKSTAALADVNAVEKYQISEDAYDKRKDTFRKFKQQIKSASGQDAKAEEEAKAAKEAKETEAAAGIKVGDRCEIDGDTENPKRGQVMFVGEGKHAPGVWVGIKLDEPVGKHNGSVKGHKYFECPDKYGVLTRPTKVQVGDYPEKDMFDELSDEDEDDKMKEL